MELINGILKGIAAALGLAQETEINRLLLVIIGMGVLIFGYWAIRMIPLRREELRQKERTNEIFRSLGGVVQQANMQTTEMRNDLQAFINDLKERSSEMRQAVTTLTDLLKREAPSPEWRGGVTKTLAQLNDGIASIRQTVDKLYNRIDQQRFGLLDLFLRRRPFG